MYIYTYIYIYIPLIQINKPPTGRPPWGLVRKPSQINKPISEVD